MANNTLSLNSISIPTTKINSRIVKGIQLICKNASSIDEKIQKVKTYLQNNSSIQAIVYKENVINVYTKGSCPSQYQFSLKNSI